MLAAGGPLINSELRIEAKGILRYLLSSSLLGEEAIDQFGYWILGKATALRQANLREQLEARGIFELSLPSDTDILDAGAMLFDSQDMPSLETVSSWANVELGTLPIAHVDFKLGIHWSALMSVLFAFARVSNRREAEGLPLSIHELRQWSCEYRASSIQLFSIPDLCQSFEFLSRLLLGGQFSKDNSSAVSLLSSWGWSIYLGCHDPSDPAEMSVTYFHVKPGVPTYRGVHKRRITNGGVRQESVAATNPSSASSTLIDASEGLIFFPGISGSGMGQALVGSPDSNTFSVTQVFAWMRQGSEKPGQWSLGFREMLNLRLNTPLLASCFCGERDQDDLFRVLPEPSQTNLKLALGTASQNAKEATRITRVWPKIVECPSTPHSESILKKQTLMGNVWLFDVSSNSAARWLQLYDFASYIIPALRRATSLTLAGPDCCFSCALSAPFYNNADKATHLVLLSPSEITRDPNGVVEELKPVANGSNHG